jgi:DNA processing protein
MGELLQAPFAAAAVCPRARRSGAPASRQPQEWRERRGWATEQERLWTLVWAECPGIGWRRLQRLEHQFGSLAVAWQANDSQLSHALTGSTALQAAELERLTAYRQRLGPEPIGDPITPRDRQRLQRQRCLLLGDSSLPESLDRLERPPLQLFWQGRGQLWPRLRERQAVAVVGTRRPSRHGEAMARAVGAALAEAGWPVVSGLAEGIDAAAHRGCLEARGRPVGVLGTPLERVYPRHHTALQAEVGRQGLLVSELAPGTPVRAGHFAQRNRLQVALAQAVVLVECPQRSGALQSAQLAWDAGLPLWVVPGDAARVSSGGSNRWLAQGASVLLDPAQLIDSIGPGPLATSHGMAGQVNHSRPTTGLAQREAALLAALGAGACLDHLCERLRQSPAQLSERLLRLELAGLVRGEPGLWWRPSTPGL